MSAMIFALALFGCTDDGTACERIPMPEQTYESRTACLAEQGNVLDGSIANSADYPSVFVQCLSRGQIAALGTGRKVDLTRLGVSFADAGG